MNPAQSSEAPQSGGSKYRYEVTKSVPGSVGKTLLECIQQNVVEKPPLMSWNSWQKWRVTICPKEGTDGFQQDAAAERSLYLAVMEALYGSDWQTQLDKAEEESTPAEKGGKRSSGSNSPKEPARTGADQATGASDIAQGAAPRGGQAPTLSGGAGGAEGDILQSQDPWGEAAAASRANTPTRDSHAANGPPGLGEPRRPFNAGESIPVPDDQANTPRATRAPDEAPQLRSPQPHRLGSASDSPEAASAKSEMSSLYSTDDPETLIQACHAKYVASEGSLQEHITKLMRNSEKLRKMDRPLSRTDLGMLTAKASYEAVLTKEEFSLLIDEYTICLLYTSPSPRDVEESRMPSSA